MLEANNNLFEKHRDILSFRDLSPNTVATYLSYLNTYITWVEENLPGRDLPSITWEEIRSYLLWLKDVKGLNPRTVNVHIAQLHDFCQYQRVYAIFGAYAPIQASEAPKKAALNHSQPSFSAKRPL